MRLLAVLLLITTSAHAEWLRLHGTNTELLTDAGEKAGRRALARLEQVRAILPGGTEASGRELRVVLFDSEKESAQCPACGEKFSTLKSECPGCGLGFGVPSED